MPDHPETDPNPSVSRDRITTIERLIRPYIRHTPVLDADAADFGLLPAPLTFKLECLQHSGSFKARGAFANLLSRDVPAAGVVAASGGNHGAAVAYAAARLGVQATIFVPSITSPAKAQHRPARRRRASLTITRPGRLGCRRRTPAPDLDAAAVPRRDPADQAAAADRNQHGVGVRRVGLRHRIRAAWLYPMEGMTQDAIAQVLGLTRARVLRMLASCREDGTVQISVTAPLTRCVVLERELEKRYGMERAIVIPRPQVESETAMLIGAATGSYLSTILADGMTIGLGWGRTVSSSLPSLPQRQFKRFTVVSLLGGLTRASVFNPSEFAWRFADRLGAECFMMAAPVFAPDARAREALINHSGMEDVFNPRF